MEEIDKQRPSTKNAPVFPRRASELAVRVVRDTNE